MVGRALAIALLVASSPSYADARTDYMLNCQGCHGSDGSGSPGHVPDLRGELGRFLREPGGRRYLVQVPGSRNAPIDDAALAAVLNWMLPAFSAATLPADFTPYSAREVGRLRRDAFESVAEERSRLLDAVDSRSN